MLAAMDDPSGDLSTEPRRAAELVRLAHQRLLGTASGLDDAQIRRASLLPEWSIGHVLTHLARLRPQVDAFFDGVMVNAEEAALRANPDITTKIEAAIRQNSGLISEQILAGTPERDADGEEPTEE